jgi:hypothetical protein|tara:strand:- start:684 stop:1019 length:336 start_codon:yes stop_codon:yes gene_type:complete
MPNKHFCQGPTCHTKTTQDRFLKSRGVVRGRYARLNRDDRNEYYPEDKFFCSLGCAKDWLAVHMENIEHGRPVEFIRHRREIGGYEKVTEVTDYGRTYNTIERVDNRAEIE